MFRFELESDIIGGRKAITTPVGWESNKPVLTRDEFYHGVIRSFTVDLSFIKDGYEYLKQIYAAGILSECLVYIYEHNNSTHEYELQDIGKVDLTTWNERDLDNGVILTITDTAFAEKIRGREDTEVNYDNTFDLDDNPMSSPIYVEQEIYGMEVVSKGQMIIPAQFELFAIRAGVRAGTFWIPTSEFDGQVIKGQSVFASFLNQDTGFFDKNTDAFFIAEAPGQLRINGTLHFEFKIDNGVNLASETYVSMERFRTGVLSETLKRWTSSGSPFELNQSLDITGIYDVLQGDSIAFIIKNGIESAVVFNNGWINILESTIELIQTDKALPTKSKGALLFDCFKRTVESITGVPNSLISQPLDVLGEYHDYTLQNGFLIRNYPTNQAALSFKFKDLFQNIEKILNLMEAIINN
jgi:hypothetical protein